MPPLVIFPEGTTCNNESVLTFKKGAFVKLKPVKIVAIKYDTNKFISYDDWMPSALVIFCYITNWYNNIEVFEFEGLYDPKYLNLDVNDENSWKVYAGKVRNIISQCL